MRNETAKLRCAVAERDVAIAKLRCEVSELRALTDILGDTIRENYLSLGVRRDDRQILAEMLAKIEVRLGRPMRSQLTYGEAVYGGEEQ